jgi:hypothetical protein
MILYFLLLLSCQPAETTTSPALYNASAPAIDTQQSRKKALALLEASYDTQRVPAAFSPLLLLTSYASNFVLVTDDSTLDTEQILVPISLLAAMPPDKKEVAINYLSSILDFDISMLSYGDEKDVENFYDTLVARNLAYTDFIRALIYGKVPNLLDPLALYLASRDQTELASTLNFFEQYLLKTLSYNPAGLPEAAGQLAAQDLPSHQGFERILLESSLTGFLPVLAERIENFQAIINYLKTSTTTFPVEISGIEAYLLTWLASPVTKNPPSQRIYTKTRKLYAQTQASNPTWEVFRTEFLSEEEIREIVAENEASGEELGLLAINFFGRNRNGSTTPPAGKPVELPGPQKRTTTAPPTLNRTQAESGKGDDIGAPIVGKVDTPNEIAPNAPKAGKQGRSWDVKVAGWVGKKLGESSLRLTKWTLIMAAKLTLAISKITVQNAKIAVKKFYAYAKNLLAKRREQRQARANKIAEKGAPNTARPTEDGQIVPVTGTQLKLSDIPPADISKAKSAEQAVNDLETEITAASAAPDPSRLELPEAGAASQAMKLLQALKDSKTRQGTVKK